MEKALIILSALAVATLMVSTATAVPATTGQPAMEKIKSVRAELTNGNANALGVVDLLKVLKPDLEIYDLSSSITTLITAIIGVLIGVVTYIPAVIVGTIASIALAIYIFIIYLPQCGVLEAINWALFYAGALFVQVIAWPFTLALLLILQ